jgi:transcriptional antiterminator NusG
MPREKVFAEDEKQGLRQWYAVHTYSGYEDAVARYLKQRVESSGLENKIFKVVVPKEKKIKVRNGKRFTVEEKIYHGYVLVEMILDKSTWYAVRNTPRVTGFVGTDPTRPTPLSREEVDSLVARMEAGEPRFKVDVRPGDLVRITDGPFRDYDGRVSEVDEERGRVKVLVPVFGRDTAVELDSLQIKKV